MTHYVLPGHVHFCSRGEALVFLDLREDDYFLVNGATADAVRALSRPEICSVFTEQMREALRELLDAGLLSSSPGEGRAVTPTYSQAATRSLLDEETSTPIFSASELARFMWACTVTAVRLRWEPLQKTIARVEHRKVRQASRVEFDVQRARDLTNAFRALRCLFPRNYLCLYDSLALVEFLAEYELFPALVFGIRLEPWAAHCWVQERDFVFNEDPEEASAYTPVMVV